MMSCFRFGRFRISQCLVHLSCRGNGTRRHQGFTTYLIGTRSRQFWPSLARDVDSDLLLTTSFLDRN